MTEEFYHTKELGFSVVTKINDIEAGIGATWSKTTRYSNGAKITTDVENNHSAPFVIMALYSVEVEISEVAYQGISRKSSGSWSDYSWSYTPSSRQSEWATIGYVAHYAFVGKNNLPNFRTGQYLIDGNSYFSDNEKFISGN